MKNYMLEGSSVQTAVSATLVWIWERIKSRDSKTKKALEWPYTVKLIWRMTFLPCDCLQSNMHTHVPTEIVIECLSQKV